jgi:AcrR family transcriptional regulator
MSLTFYLLIAHIRGMRPARPAPPRRPTLKDQKREETRARLLAAARRLFAEYGYDDVPVTEIAKEAGVTHSMINVYFGGKAGLLYEIVRTNNEPQYVESKRLAETGRPPLDRLSEMLLFWVLSDGADPRLLAIMQGFSWVWPPQLEAENAADRGRHKELVADLICEAQRSGVVSSSVDPRQAASSVFAIYTWGLRGVVFEGLTPEQCHARIMEQLRPILRA